MQAFWTVDVDNGRLKEPSYILSSGEPDQPEKEQAGRARLAVCSAEDRIPRWQDRSVLRLAYGARESVFCASGSQPALAMALRRRSSEDPQRFWQLGRTASQSAAARLAGVGVCRQQIRHEGDAQADGHVRDLQACVVTGTRCQDVNTKIDPANDYLWTFRLNGLRPSRSGIRSWQRPELWTWPWVDHRSISFPLRRGAPRRCCCRRERADAAFPRRRPARRLYAARFLHQPGGDG